MIKAEAHSDDRVFEVDFDATRWFKQASDEQITALIGCEFGGDYPADEVAVESSNWVYDLQPLFDYLERVDCGFECHVDETDARAWLRANRPHLNV